MYECDIKSVKNKRSKFNTFCLNKMKLFIVIIPKIPKTFIILYRCIHYYHTSSMIVVIHTMNHIEEGHVNLPSNRSMAEDDRTIDLGNEDKLKSFKLIDFFKEDLMAISKLRPNVSYELSKWLGENPSLYDFKSFVSHDKAYEITKELLTSRTFDDKGNVIDVKESYVIDTLDKHLFHYKFVSLALDDFYKSPNSSIVKEFNRTIINSLLNFQQFEIIIKLMALKSLQITFPTWCRLTKEDTEASIDASLKSHFKFLQRLYLGTSKEKDLKDFKNSWDRIQDKIFQAKYTLDEVNECAKLMAKSLNNYIYLMNWELTHACYMIYILRSTKAYI